MGPRDGGTSGTGTGTPIGELEGSRGGYLRVLGGLEHMMPVD